MALILRKAWDGYKLVFEDLTDPRVTDLPLLGKPYQGLALLCLYLMFVLKWGPKYMENRKPFNLDKVLIAYNAFQAVSCAYIFFNVIGISWGWNYKWFCEPVNYSDDPKALEMIRLYYFFFLLKIVDLLDTVFFIFRKKFNQVSFLHIYHHTGMVILIWVAATYYPGGHATSVGVINSFVHVAMYSYYLLTVAAPGVKKEIWLKKCITQIQIIQFLLLVVHMGSIIFIPDCGYPRWTAAAFLPQNIFMLVLFIDFYIKTYIRKPKQGTQNRKANRKILNGNDHYNGLSKEHDSKIKVKSAYYEASKDSSFIEKNRTE